MKKIFLFVILSLILLSACNNSNNQPSQPETVLKVYCDNGFYDAVKVPSDEFDSLNITLKIDLTSTTAFDCMAKLLSGDAKAVILSREYSSSEDSLMQKYKVGEHPREPIAHDALTFYTNVDVQLDTITDKQLHEIFTNPKVNFNTYYSKSPITTIVCNSHLSSEYFNLKKYLIKDKQIAKKLLFFNGVDSVKNYVKSNKNAVGIGYLSQIKREPNLKPIQVSFIDSTGKYQYPRSVHQANIVRGFYPYIITHYIYLLDKQTDVAMAYSRFLTKNGKAQTYFNKIGIVPAFGKIRLIAD